MSHELILRDVECFFETFVPKLPTGIRVCAAVSGGCDSVALFHALSALREKLGIVRLGIAHVNHKLRGAESDADAAFVQALGDKAGVSFHEKVLGPRPGKPGMEEWARGERYAFFNHLREAEGYDYVATGHTADDQAETVCMRIMRGCGLKGLFAIAPVREDRVIRPLLHIKKASLQAWLMETDSIYREDSSNKDITYHRNLVRHKLLPAFLTSEPLAGELLPGIAQGAFAAWQLLSCSINKWIALYVLRSSDGHFEIAKQGFVDFPFVHEALAEALRQKHIRLDRLHVEEIISNAPRTRGSFLLPGGWRYRCGRNVIEFTKHDVMSAGLTCDHVLTAGTKVACESANISIESTLFRLNEAEPLCFCRDNMTVYLDADEIKGPVEFRNVKPDDVFQPLGSREKRNVKEFLKKRKKDYRVQGIVAEKNGDILWIPGVQISHHCRVKPQTTAILKFSCKPL